MRILAAIVIPPHLRVSGAVKAATELSRHLAQRASVDIALMSRREHESRAGQARLLERRATNPLAFTRGFLPDRYRTLFYRSDIAGLLRGGAYDVVHLHNPIPALELRRIARACRRLATPYAFSTHGLVEIASGGKAYGVRRLTQVAWNRWIDRPLREVLAGATMVFALSPADLPILTGFGVAESRIGVVTNGVDAEAYASCPTTTMHAFLERFGLPQDKDPEIPVTVFLGNHTRNKGIDLLLQAFEDTSKPFLLIVAGRKKPQNVDYARFEQRADPRRRIVFTDGISDDEAVALFHYADLLAFPTRADTLPLVVLEALASGTPVLATRVGGIPHQVDDSCGLLVAPDDAQALRRGYEALWDRRAALPGMGAAGRARVHRNFDWSRSAEAAMGYFRNMLRGRPS